MTFKEEKKGEKKNSAIRMSCNDICDFLLSASKLREVENSLVVLFTRSIHASLPGVLAVAIRRIGHYFARNHQLYS